MELVAGPLYPDLLPADATLSAKAGLEAYEHYCLSCHTIDGVGGQKVKEDMRKLVAGKSRDELRTWIGDPRRIRPCTTMPALNPALDADERQRAINQIVDFLESL